MRLLEWLFELPPRPPKKVRRRDFDVIRFYTDAQYRADVTVSLLGVDVLDESDLYLWDLVKGKRLLRRMWMVDERSVGSQKFRSFSSRVLSEGQRFAFHGCWLSVRAVRQYLLPTVEAFYENPMGVDLYTVFSFTPILGFEFTLRGSTYYENSTKRLFMKFREYMPLVLKLPLYHDDIMQTLRSVWAESTLLLGDL